MPGNAVMLAGDWIYDESARETYDCDSLEKRQASDRLALNECEKQVLKAFKGVMSRKMIPN